MNNAEIEIVRTKRKTIGGYARDGKITVRVPKTASDKEILRFLEKYGQKLSEMAKKQLDLINTARQEGIITKEDINRLKPTASVFFKEKADYYASLLGVGYGKITVRTMTSRWGSCTSEGNLSFNGLLAYAPEKAAESVVAHELCHRLYMNHGKDFYSLLLKIFPEYNRWDKWLKTEGRLLLKRLDK